MGTGFGAHGGGKSGLLFSALAMLSFSVNICCSQGWQIASNLTLKADLAVRETFDSNVYLQDHDPSPTVTNAARPFRESMVTSVMPRLALEYKPSSQFNALVSYSPEAVFYHSESSENHVTHRGLLNFNGTDNGVAWDQPNSFTWIDGEDKCLFFGAPGGAPALGGIPTRDRRDAFIYRGGFRATIPLGEWFVRPVASAYVHEFFTEQLNSRLPQYRGYENYVDRSDVNGGLDIGHNIAPATRIFAGYRYGYQNEGELITEPGIEYDNEYHRVLFGIEGQPWRWMKLNIALGPEFHHSTATTATNFDGNYSVLYVDASVTLMPTQKDSVTLAIKQFTQTAFASCSVYEDTTYDIVWKHTFDSQWSAGAGFRAYNGDWLHPVRRNDWLYTVSAVVSRSINKHLSCEVSYLYDWADSLVSNTSGREYTRHLASVALKGSF
ncbi:MAG TPA: hypothetical protein PKA41_09170 [Verrucomicrobiota bacterium]|nr:hypothetical protein [Verrucomicrobiota bacterium]